MRGHPWIVASKGRVGFSADDLRALRARGAARPVPVLLAARSRARHARLPTGAARAASTRRPASCRCHPWQWANRIQPLYAGDIARGRIRLLGELGGALAAAAVDPHAGRRRRTRRATTSSCALSILNTSVYRGLPRDRTLAAPALSAWLRERVRRRPVPARDGLILLGEVASVSVAHRAFEAIDGRARTSTPSCSGRSGASRSSRYLRAGRAGDHAGRAAAPRPGGRRVRRAADRALAG